MKNNETGEFELVLGNKQLLSGFFIVVILFAVFFVMGYIVGRNSTPASQMAANRDQPGGAAAVSGARPQPSSGTVPAPQNPVATETPKDDAPASEQPATQAAQSPPAKTAPPPAAEPAAPAAVEPAPGETYLQVTAVKAEVAETVAKTLKEKGFPAVLSAGPAGKVRVLVGPYADLAKLGQAKAELERLGFSPFVKR
jgi:cell division septation protein DedD